ncbi:hypothetical protein NDU88_001401 [Pleurodeles waltl]|uniref:Uncharacterized protein n=1 Tax=Pleurodeles waltl TaxID=8319 RepID=A0AAV7P8K7_PLEWA|nr:hypothetical protein NDU88_001401 [Pleurodeles waltl]
MPKKARALPQLVTTPVSVLSRKMQAPTSEPSHHPTPLDLNKVHSALELKPPLPASDPKHLSPTSEPKKNYITQQKELLTRMKHVPKTFNEHFPKSTKHASEHEMEESDIQHILDS